jgi:uncharacterized sulfatase
MNTPKPNFLVVLTDTQPTSFVGCYGSPGVQTPCLDALARDGVRFEHAYTTAPLCTPARAGLFTGMMPSMAGAYTNTQPLCDTVLTMGQRFSAAGYRCGYIGKWHLDGYDYFGTGECPPGWEDAFWYDGRRYLTELSPEQVTLWRRGLMTLKALKENQITSEFTWAHRIADRAERFLGEQKSDRPFLLVTSFDEPHHPFTCPPEFVEAFMDYQIDLGPAAFDPLTDKPEHQREWAESWLGVKEPTGFYHSPMMLGCNAYLDSQIGRIVSRAQALSKQSGAPTWILFTSDHGDHLGTHRLLNKGPTGYEANTRIPLIVVAPDGRGAGTVQHSVVSHADILPTMLRAAGLPVPEILDGEDFLDLVGSSAVSPQRRAVMEYTRYEVSHDGFGGLEPLRMIVRWPWKLVVNLFRTDELYNLAEDADELHNRITDPACAEDRDLLHDSLLDWMDEHIDPQRGLPWQRRAWRDAARPHWKAPTRPVRDDGARPPYLDYDTGFPTQGTAMQYADDSKK